MENISTHQCNLLVEEFVLWMTKAPSLGKSFMIGSPSYGVLDYKLDEFDISFRVSRIKTVAQNYPIEHFNGCPATVYLWKISGKNFFIERERLWEASYHDDKFNYNNISLYHKDVYKIEWVGDISDFVGAICYLRMLAIDDS